MPGRGERGGQDCGGSDALLTRDDDDDDDGWIGHWSRVAERVRKQLEKLARAARFFL